MAEVHGATEMMDVSQAHIDGCSLLSESGLEFAETLARLGGQVSIPTTLNVIPLDLQNWRKLGVPETFAGKAIRLAQAYTDMGCIPTWTCAPYQGYLTPRFGQQIAWGESNAIVYANSVLGARTNRYGDYIDICAAIAGRVPRSGLHLRPNRRGQLLVRLANIEPATMATDDFYPVFGHFLGNLAQDKIPVIEGLPSDATTDQLKALGAAAASSGAVALFHAVNLTPEANTLEAALQGCSPEQAVAVHPADLMAARSDMSTAENYAKVDTIVLGCPHFSYAEFCQLERAIRSNGHLRHSEVRAIVFTNQATYATLQRSEILHTIEGFGVEIILDTCPFLSPVVSPDAKVLMTNSGKCAYYAPGELGLQVAFGSVADCVRSATRGVVCRE
jgi:predicted aconitase